jgi:hypothetical protein
MSSLGRRLVIMVTAIAVALLGAPVAQAAKGPGKVSTGTATTAIAGGTAGSAIATCPKGKAFGGGYASPNPQAAVAPVRVPLIYESRRRNPKSWVVSANNLGTSTASLDLTAIVYCRKGKISQKASPVSIATPSRSEAAATAICASSNSHVVSGGFRLPPYDPATGRFLYLVANVAASARSWRVHPVASGSAPAPQTFTSFVYCAAGRKGAKARSSSTATTTASGVDRHPTTTTRTCKKPGKPLGGGFLAPYTDSGLSRATTFVTESRRAGRAWTTSGLAVGGAGLTVSLTGLGYCS